MLMVMTTSSSSTFADDGIFNQSVAYRLSQTPGGVRPRMRVLRWDAPDRLYIQIIPSLRVGAAGYVYALRAAASSSPYGVSRALC
eukprot:COSAG01_NODE_6571_length_3603_cov_4.638128_4_plen_85_part_00